MVFLFVFCIANLDVLSGGLLQTTDEALPRSGRILRFVYFGIHRCCPGHRGRRPIAALCIALADDRHLRLRGSVDNYNTGFYLELVPREKHSEAPGGPLIPAEAERVGEGRQQIDDRGERRWVCESAEPRRE